VPPRFLKERGTNTLTGQINAELVSRRLPPVKNIEVSVAGGQSLRHFIRRRQHGGTAPPADIGLALRLEFAEPVCGPISLGYASHFGLGRFISEKTK
jgi:CRISPR-associated protein Csb2